MLRESIPVRMGYLSSDSEEECPKKTYSKNRHNAGNVINIYNGDKHSDIPHHVPPHAPPSLPHSLPPSLPHQHYHTEEIVNHASKFEIHSIDAIKTLVTVKFSVINVCASERLNFRVFGTRIVNPRLQIEDKDVRFSYENLDHSQSLIYFSLLHASNVSFGVLTFVPSGITGRISIVAYRQ